MLLAFVFLTYGGLSISLEDLGMYEASLNVCALSNGNYLWVGPVDNVLAVTDAEGHLLHRYDKAGSGPKSLDRPMLFGYDLEKIFIVNDKRIQVYDHKLEKLEINMPPIFQNNTGGLYLDKNRFALQRSRLPEDGIRVVSLDNGRWVKERSEMPLPFDYLDKQGKYVTRNNVVMANGFVFHHKDMDLNDDQQMYQIDVYQIDKAGQVKSLLKLSADLDSFPEFGTYRSDVSTVARVEDGYICDVVFLKRERGLNWVAGYLDIYDLDGNLIRRQKVNRFLVVLKVHGKNQAALLSDEELNVYLTSSINDIPNKITSD